MSSVAVVSPPDPPPGPKTSVFVSAVAGHVTRTWCPPHTPDIVETACNNHVVALQQYQKRRIMEFLRAPVAKYIGERAVELLATTPRATPTTPLPAAKVPDEWLQEAIKDEIKARTDQKLLIESDAAILLGYCFDQRALLIAALDQNLELQEILQEQRNETLLTKERLEAALAASKDPKLKYRPAPPPGEILVTPTEAMNTKVEQPRFFRVLVWNLENFTRDQRPNHTSPIDSLRNQVRIAAVAQAMHLFDIDLVLVMETGSDVGQAMTKIEQRLKTLRPLETRQVHPFVSATTHARPVVDTHYKKASVGRPSPYKALSLRALSEVYTIAPNAADFNTNITVEQITNSLKVLRGVAPDVASVPGIPDTAVAATYPSALEALAMLLLLAHTAFVGYCREEEEKLKNMPVAEAMENAAAGVDLVIKGLVAKNLAIAQNGDPVVPVIAEIREVLGVLAPYPAMTRFSSALRSAELLLLFVLKAVRPADAGHEVAACFSSRTAGAGLSTLCAFWCSGAPSLDLTSIDPHGPLQGSLDPDVLFEALLRIGVLEFRFETYGFVYREPVPGTVSILLEEGVLKGGDSKDSDTAERAIRPLDVSADQYGIVTESLSGEDFALQRPGHVLNLRSAFRVMIPASYCHLLPLALYHTRYTGNKEIAAAYLSTHGFSKAGSDVFARCDSLQQTAMALVPGSKFWGAPLIVGDFNIPGAYLEPSGKSDSEPDKIRASLWTMMAAVGFLRHDLRQPPSTDAVSYPRTTLKANTSIAAGDAILSETYDGIYEPMGYAAGFVALNSGALKLSGIMTPELVTQTVTGEIPNWEEILSDESLDDDDDQDLVDTSDDGRGASKAAEKTISIIEAIAAALGTEYRRFFGRLKSEKKKKPPSKRLPPTLLGLLEELSEHLDSALKRAQNSRRVVKFFDKPMFDELKALVDVVAKHRDERVNWFFKQCSSGKFDLWAGKDELAAAAAVIQTAADSGVQLSFPLDKVQTAITRLQAQLKGLETSADIRYSIAYRLLVSDHLPTMLEFELCY